MNSLFGYTYDVLRKKTSMTISFVDFKYCRIVLKKGTKTYVVDTHGASNITVYVLRGKTLIKLIETNEPKLAIACIK